MLHCRVLAVMHTPIYNTFKIHQRDEQVAAAREHLEPLFVKHKVNLVFTGHVHAHLRTSPVAFGNLNSTAPVHITVGAGGRGCNGPFRSLEPEPWVEVRDATMFGYGTFRIYNHTSAVWKYHTTGQHREHNRVWANKNLTIPPIQNVEAVHLQNQYYA